MAWYYTPFQTQVISMLTTVVANQEKMMTGLTDLEAAVTKLEAEQVQILADIQTILSENAGDSDAAVAAVAARVNVVTAALVAGDPVPPLVPPTPAP
jgi:predicted RecB family endonuclease